MNPHPKLQTLGAVLSDPSRVAMLCELMDGRAYTSTELAAHAGITPQTASAHLTRLRRAGLIRSDKSGRSLYHRIPDADTAALLEHIAQFTATDHLYRAGCRRGRDLLVARTCYNHLAGRLGVAITDALTACGAVSATNQGLLAKPNAVWDALGVLPGAAPLKACLDWTERRTHISGPTATALMETALTRGWLRRGRSRAVAITPAGRDAFSRILGIDTRRLETAE